jgi:hypothetical protein
LVTVPVFGTTRRLLWCFGFAGFFQINLKALKQDGLKEEGERIYLGAVK